MVHKKSKKYPTVLKWKSVYEAPTEEIERRFKKMYGKKPTSEEMEDILFEGEF
jgi:hypothetical protein